MSEVIVDRTKVNRDRVDRILHKVIVTIEAPINLNAVIVCRTLRCLIESGKMTDSMFSSYADDPEFAHINDLKVNEIKPLAELL